MTKQFALYRCDMCGTVAEIIQNSRGGLACCGREMRPLAENSVEIAVEKHLPVIETNSAGCRVSVGALPHPMEAKHSIRWIELLAEGFSCKKMLNPGEAPEVFFPGKFSRVHAREYCNLHGLWKV
ncbi:MAG: desulfoferrodoxin [Treponema sp.]|jgi:superoxide reductase|nr:desulfoferrodoxin [Treponema sp.]